MATSHRDRVGVWLVGARGGLATTLLCGVELIRRGLASPSGLVTETPLFDGAPLPPLDALEFGGHDPRRTTLYDAALEIYRDNGSIPYDKLQEIRPALAELDRRIRPGTTLNCGGAIAKVAGRAGDRKPLRAVVRALQDDLIAFKKERRVDRLIVVNLASTEPPLAARPEHASLAAFECALDADRRAAVRASTLYAYAAVDLGAAFVNFTPSDGALIPAVRELAEARGVPWMGDDGKTGETLVKSALAPMFKYRNLRVLSWQGYNILGDRDGQVLADRRNKLSKVASKDSVLSGILGYPLHTHVGIDYVPSLGDRKTAWDFVHFAGFLDHRMALTFTWHGCDAVLAAPLVLDMARLAAVALARRESGPMRQLACFFKRPRGVGEQ
ncbi:MAG TPA: inositol-3-phosphate synthase, partial [Planctomycetota bacterium]|nr:inositol-3-phosphate synthase [Planctomycetota bacterium]